jgi:hypothetical protein
MRILAEPKTAVTVLWLTTADVARMLDLSAAGVRWLARDGRLASERTVSGQRLFRPTEVQRFAERRMRARLTGLAGRRTKRWSGGRGEPRQLPLFGATLRIVGGRG